MAEKASKSKIKILYVLKLFIEKTDENHYLSTTDIINYLNDFEISCDRKSIYSDIEALQQFGYDIAKGATTKKGYALLSRDYEVPEVKLLVDAVQSAGFITPKKTAVLLNKLEKLISESQAKQLRTQIYIDNRIKCNNEQIYIIIDNINNAISNNVKVKFIYTRKSINKNKHIYNSEKTHTISPYALMWQNDHYYLVGNNEKYDNLMHLRVDRIHSLQILDEKSRDFRECSTYKDYFDTADYAKKHFNMFSGDTQTVKIICDFSILEEIQDRFGNNISLEAYDESHFITEIQAAVSDGLVSWIMQYGNKIKIKSPEKLRNMYLDKINAIVEMYN